MSRRQFFSPIQPCRCAWWRLGVDLTFSLFLEKSQRAGDQTHDFWFLHIHVEVNDGESLFTATLIKGFFSMFYLVVCEEDLMRFHQKLQPKDDVHVQLNIIHMYVFYTDIQGSTPCKPLLFLLVKRFLPVTLHYPGIRTSFSAKRMHFQSKTHLSLWIPELQFFRNRNTFWLRTERDAVTGAGYSWDLEEANHHHWTKKKTPHNNK